MAGQPPADPGVALPLTPYVPMAFRLRFPTVFSSLAAAAEAARPTPWGRCLRCERITPWHVDADRGEYRCSACGRPALGG